MRAKVLFGTELRGSISTSFSRATQLSSELQLATGFSPWRPGFDGMALHVRYVMDRATLVEY